MKIISPLLCCWIGRWVVVKWRKKRNESTLVAGRNRLSSSNTKKSKMVGKKMKFLSNLGFWSSFPKPVRRNQESSRALKAASKERKGGKRRCHDPSSGKVIYQKQGVGAGDSKKWGDKSHSISCKGETSNARKTQGLLGGENASFNCLWNCLMSNIEIWISLKKFC